MGNRCTLNGHKKLSYLFESIIWLDRFKSLLMMTKYVYISSNNWQQKVIAYNIFEGIDLVWGCKNVPLRLEVKCSRSLSHVIICRFESLLMMVEYIDQ